jgi:hypothetical protein
MGLFMLWCGDENHPTPDLSAAGVSDKSGFGITGYVDAGYNRLSRKAILSARDIKRYFFKEQFHYHCRACPANGSGHGSHRSHDPPYSLCSLLVIRFSGG